MIELKPTNNIRTPGAILILFAAVLLVLIGFAALVIDTGVTESTRGEVQQASQNAALGAMASYLEYLRTPPAAGATPNYAGAAAYAKSSAQRLLQNNRYIGQSFRSNPGDSSFDLGGNGAYSGANGSIDYGLYHWAAAATPRVPDPCHRHYPCFESVGPGNKANAVRLSANFGTNHLKAIFGRIFGQEYFDFSAQTIATQLPQNYAFLVDLSNSVVGTNHKEIGFGLCQTDICDPPCPTGPCNATCRPGVCGPTDPCRSQSNQWTYNPICWYSGSAALMTYELSTSNGAQCNDWDTGASCDCMNQTDEPPYMVNFENCLEDYGYPSDPRGNIYRYIFRGQRPSGAFITQYYNGQTTNVVAPLVPIDPALGWQDIDPRVHRREDYRVVTVDFGADLAPRTVSPGVEKQVAIDFGNPIASSRDYYPILSTGYGPEPLFSIFRAAYQAMGFIVSRAVSSDQFMFAGFDETIYRSRVTCSDGVSSPTCQSKFVPITDPGFERFRHAVNIDNSADRISVSSNPSHFINLGLFPLPKMNTDAQMMLWDTYDELSRLDTFAQAKNLVFMFTDGLFNCGLPTYWTGGPVTFPGQYLTLRQCGGVETGNPALGANPSIGRGLKVFNTISQISSETQRAPLGKSITEIFAEKKIAVSVVLVGDGIGAHHLVRASRTSLNGSGRPSACMDLSEAVIQGEDWVDWNKDEYSCDASFVSTATIRCSRATSWLIQDCVPFGACTYRVNRDFNRMTNGDADPDFKFYLPNLLYSALVAPTKGTWIPVMPVLLDAGGRPVNFESALTTACTASNVNPGDIIRNLPYGGTTVTDGDGRLKYHPKGWSMAEQIQNEVEKVLGGGYLLVEPPR